jgi:hypothetical protein
MAACVYLTFLPEATESRSTRVQRRPLAPSTGSITGITPRPISAWTDLWRGHRAGAPWVWGATSPKQPGRREWPPI